MHAMLSEPHFPNMGDFITDAYRIQTGADMDSELQTAQETVEFNMGG